MEIENEIISTICKAGKVRNGTHYDSSIQLTTLYKRIKQKIFGIRPTGTKEKRKEKHIWVEPRLML